MALLTDAAAAAAGSLLKDIAAAAAAAGRQQQQPQPQPRQAAAPAAAAGSSSSRTHSRSSSGRRPAPEEVEGEGKGVAGAAAAPLVRGHHLAHDHVTGEEALHRGGGVERRRVAVVTGTRGGSAREEALRGVKRGGAACRGGACAEQAVRKGPRSTPVQASAHPALTLSIAKPRQLPLRWRGREAGWDTLRHDVGRPWHANSSGTRNAGSSAGSNGSASNRGTTPASPLT